MATDKTVPVERSRGEAPAGSLLTLRGEIDRLFDDVLGGFGAPFSRRFFDLDPFRRPLAEAGAVMPKVDVAETDQAFTITAEMPGLDEKDVEVTLADDVLTIKGERREEKEEKNKDFHLVERRASAFHRAFRLPDGVDGEKISAACDKGVLTVTLPKRPQKAPEAKKIQVKKS
jgi:HSP20 family protein